MNKYSLQKDRKFSLLTASSTAILSAISLGVSNPEIAKIEYPAAIIGASSLYALNKIMNNPKNQEKLNLKSKIGYVSSCILFPTCFLSFISYSMDNFPDPFLAASSGLLAFNSAYYLKRGIKDHRQIKKLKKFK